jgi:hypothetical protein
MRETIRVAVAAGLALSFSLPFTANAQDTTAQETNLREQSAPENFRFGGHVGFGYGGTLVNGTGQRQTLDISADYLHPLGKCEVTSAPIATCYGLMVSSSVVTAFSATSTYLSLDGGYAINGMIGGHLLAGPAVRLGPQPGVGFDFQAIAYLFILAVGPRVLVIPSGDREVQLTFVAAVGFN